jgi:hypothetical protein
MSSRQASACRQRAGKTAKKQQTHAPVDSSGRDQRAGEIAKNTAYIKFAYWGIGSSQAGVTDSAEITALRTARSKGQPMKEQIRTFVAVELS